MKRRQVVLLGWLVLVMLSALVLPVAPARAASGTVDPPQGWPNTLFTFTAEGFLPNERVDAWVTRPDATPRTPSIGRYVADATGRVSWTWVAPGDTEIGQWVMVARGVDSDIEVDIPFEIIGESYEVPRVQSVMPTSGLPGTTFVFQLGGFQAGERVGAWIVRPDGASLSLPIDVATNIYADRAGVITFSWTSPADAPVGTWSAQARGIRSNLQFGLPFQIVGAETAPPSRSVTPTSGPPGTTFTFFAEGFTPGEEVGTWLIPPGGGNLDATPYLLADAVAGTATWTWVAPGDAAGGIWRMNARGQTSGYEIFLDFEVQGPAAAPPAPTLQTVTPHEGLPGTRFIFFAEGFTPGETVFYWLIDPNGVPVPNDVELQANGQGQVQWEWQTREDTRAGQWTMVTRGAASRVEHQIPITVISPDYVPPETGVVPGTGGPGTVFQFAATGYNGSEFIDWWAEGPDGVFIRGNVKDPDVKPNSDGYLRWKWRAPDDIIAGQWRMHMQGRDSRHLQTVEFTIVRDTPPPPPPQATVTPASGPPGTTFTFFAEGFDSLEVVGYWLDDPDNEVIRIDKEVVANSKGEIVWEWTAPPDAKCGEWRMIAETTGLDLYNGPTENEIKYVIPFTIE